MLELILAAFIPFLPASVEGQSSSGYEIVELFHADTSDELEAALSGGYPMPWLEEILNDESIPEEDRYWLDCRMRAVIAQEFHLFFDREGNPTSVDADWIKYGEPYWRENFIVNPQGQHNIEDQDSETGLWGETGQVLNRFGENVGNLALCEEWMQLSRDGSVGILAHKGSEDVTEYGPAFLFMVYSDGSYRMLSDELWIYDYALSQSGDYALLVQRDSDEHNVIKMYNRNGDCIWSLPALARVVSADLSISPEDEFCCVPSNESDPVTHYLQVLRPATGEEVETYEGIGVSSSFSPDGNQLCIGSGYIVEMDPLSSPVRVQRPLPGYSIGYLTCANSMQRYAGVFISFDRDNEELYKLISWSSSGVQLTTVLPQLVYPNLSPNGLFLLAESLPAVDSDREWFCNLWFMRSNG